MRIRRAIAAASIGLMAVAAGLFATPARAANEPTVSASFEECDGGGMIAVSISGTESNVIVELGGVGFTLPAGEYSLGPWGDDEYAVVFKYTYDGEPFVTANVTVNCEPGVELSAVCDSPAGGIGLALTDESTSTYSVAIDVAIVAEGISDTQGSEVVYAPYADGEHLVEVYWAGDEEDDPFASLTIDKDCGAAGSAGAIPETGSSSRELALTAGLLVAAGSAVLLLRRVPAARSDT